MDKCQSCGALLYQDDKFCRKCGAKIETSAPLQDVQEEVHFAYDIQESVPAASQGDSASGQMPAVKALPNTQKKKAYKKWIAAAAVLCLITAGAFAIFANQLPAANPADDPQAYLQEALKTELQDGKEKLIDALYSVAETEKKDTNHSFDANVDVSFGTLASSLLSQFGLNMNQVSFDLSFVDGSDTDSADASLIIDGQESASMQAVYDSITKLLNIRIPELSSDYLSADINTILEDMQNELNLEGYESLEAQYNRLYADYMDLLAQIPTKEEMQASIDLYIEFLLSCIPADAAFTNAVSVTAERLTAEYDRYSITLTNERMLEMAEKLVDTFETDPLFQNADEEFSSQEEDVIQEMRNELLDLRRSFEQNNELDQELGLVQLYLDDEDAVRGIDFIGTSPVSEEYKIGYYSITNQGDYEQKLFFAVEDAEQLAITNQYELKDNAYTGSLTFETSTYYDDLFGPETTAIHVNYSDLTWDDSKQIYKGHLAISVDGDIPELTGIVVNIDFDCTEQGGTASIDVKFLVQSLIKITFDIQKTNKTDAITIDPNETFYDISDIEEYLDHADPERFFLNFINIMNSDTTVNLFNL